ncbi:FecR domain-containing protein [Spongiibacter tropicus]|uniref:FecR domain-containing protein n=1 Tax=Spongiibacter tropicus TaxID=454602 RepID=UPI0003B527C3|nr:FecR domain-containing protein [Spongiibacter tropicus]
MSLEREQHRALREASQWYARLADEQVDSDAERAWRHWVAADEANQRAWQYIEAVSQRFDGLRDVGNSLPVGDTLKRLQRRRLTRRGSLKCIAALGVTSVATWMFAPYEHWLAGERTAVGEVRQLSLMDGSRVWLNTDSSLDSDLGAGRRRLSVHRGDVFVEAVAGKSPMTVTTAAAELSCERGRFALRGGGDAQAQVLAVYDGRVDLRTRGGQVQQLAAGKQCRFGRDAIVAVEAAEPRYEAWTRRLLLAHNESLGELLSELSRYRHGIIHVSPDVAALRVTGSFPTSNTDMALEMLGASLPIRVDVPLPWWVNVSAA